MKIYENSELLAGNLFTIFGTFSLKLHFIRILKGFFFRFELSLFVSAR